MVSPDLEPVPAPGPTPDEVPTTLVGTGAPTVPPPPPEPGVPPPAPPSKRRVPLALIIGVVVVVIAGGIAGFALSGSKKKTVSTTTAAPPANGAGARRFNGVAGTLASVDGDTLIVTSANGVKTTVTATSATTVTQAVTGALTDIKVGDRVIAIGTANGTNSVEARTVSDTGAMTAGAGNGFGFGGGGGGGAGGAANPNRPRRNPNGANGTGGFNPANLATGTVQSISGNNITVTRPNGPTMTIVTDATTTFSVIKATSLSSLTTGQQVTVRGTKNSNGTFTATGINEGDAGFGFGRGGFGGGGGGAGGPGAGAGGTTGGGTGA